MNGKLLLSIIVNIIFVFAIAYYFTNNQEVYTLTSEVKKNEWTTNIIWSNAAQPFLQQPDNNVQAGNNMQKSIISAKSNTDKCDFSVSLQNDFWDNWLNQELQEKTKKILELSIEKWEDYRFYRAFHSWEKCEKLFEDYILENLCNIIVNNKQNSYTKLVWYDEYEDNKEKNKVLWVASKFLWNDDNICDKVCEESYNDFLIIKENNINTKDIFNKSISEITTLLINWSISKDELITIASKQCIKNSSKKQ